MIIMIIPTTAIILTTTTTTNPIYGQPDKTIQCNSIKPTKYSSKKVLFCKLNTSTFQFELSSPYAPNWNR